MSTEDSIGLKQGNIIIWESKDFAVIDKEKPNLTKKELEKKAREFAEDDANLQKIDSELLSPERQIVNNYDRQLNDLVGIFDSAEKRAIQGIQNKCFVNLIDQDWNKDYLTRAGQECVSTRQSDRPNLVKTFESKLEHARALRSFKQENKLDRPASYPKTRWEPAALVLLFFVLESIINSVAFLNIGGIFHGILIAAFVSAINFFFGFLNGVGWKFLFHIKNWRKSIGTIIVSVTSLLGLAWALAAGHFREEAENFDGLGSVGFSALTKLVSTPFLFKDILGYGLVAFTLALFIYFSYKGFGSFSDKYLGYTAVSKAFDNANDQWEDCRLDTFDKVSSIYDNPSENEEGLPEGKIQFVELTKAEEAKKLSIAKTALNDLSDLKSTISDRALKRESDANAMLESFRIPYAKIRNYTPDRFSSLVNALSEMPNKINTLSLETAQKLIDNIEDNVNKNAQVYNQCISQLIKNQGKEIQETEKFIESLTNNIEKTRKTGSSIEETNEVNLETISLDKPQ